MGKLVLPFWSPGRLHTEGAQPGQRLWRILGITVDCADLRFMGY